VGEVRGVDEVGIRVACRGARSGGDRRSEIEVAPKRRGLRHYMTDLGAYFLYQIRHGEEGGTSLHVGLETLFLVLTFCINSTRA
jgi:hypothetical protein